MPNDLGRINIFTLTQEAAKAAMAFISSLPTNEDGFETLVSGSTWVAVMATNLTTDTRATTTSTAGQYTILLGGAVQFRARVSACSGCSVTVAGRFIPGMVAN